MSCIISQRINYYTYLVISMRSSSDSYCVDHSLPSYLYYTLMLLSNFYYYPTSSSFLWNWPNLKKALPQRALIIRFNSCSKLLVESILFLCLFALNLVSQGSTIRFLFVLIFDDEFLGLIQKLILVKESVRNDRHFILILLNKVILLIILVMDFEKIQWINKTKSMNDFCLVIFHHVVSEACQILFYCARGYCQTRKSILFLFFQNIFACKCVKLLTKFTQHRHDYLL